MQGPHAEQWSTGPARPENGHGPDALAQSAVAPVRLAPTLPQPEAWTSLGAPDPPAVEVGDRRPRGLRSRLDPSPWLLAIADVAAAGVALTLLEAVVARPLSPVVMLCLPLLLLSAHAAGLYDHDRLRLQGSTLDEAPALVQISAIFALAVAIVALPGPTGPRSAGLELSTSWAGMFAALVVMRCAARSALYGVEAERILVVGDPSRAAFLRRRLAAATHGRSAVVANVACAELAAGRGAADVRATIAALGVDRVLVAPTTEPPAAIDEVVRGVRASGVRLTLAPQVLDAIGPVNVIEDVEGVMLVGVPAFGMTRPAAVSKRVLDLTLLLAGAIVAIPLMAAIAVAVRLDSPGPVFFRQTRVGRDGRPFRIWKFRSMVADAEERKVALLELNEVGEGMFKLRDDPRATRVGRVLRRTSLDELPQLLNVLRGEMSLVGPRPLVVDEDDRVCGLDRGRLALLPGMTGPWQIGARAPMEDMLRIDYLYVANWSPWLDVKILLRTVRHVLRRSNV